MSYTDDFQSYATPSDPPGWIDNPVGTPRREADGLFKAWPDPLAASNIVYGTKQASGQPDGNTPRIGSFSTLMTRDFSGRGRFEYRGRMLRTTADARIGLTFFSAYSDVDAYYLVGLWSRPSGGLSMQLHGFGAGVLSGTTDSGFVPDPNVWYRFVIQADDTGGETRIRVRFWRDGTPEPSTFAIEAVDAAATRRTSGKIGMWAAVRGDAYVDDISAKSPVDHTAPVITVLESGNPLADGSKFNRDAVPEIRVTDDLSSFDYTATLDGASYTSLTPVTADGWHTLVVNAVDGPGNAAELTLRFLVDKTAPVVAILESGKPLPSGFAFNRDVIVTANVVDATNTTVVATLDGQPYVPGTPITAEGDHAIAVTATDEVGWSTTAGPIPFTIDKTAPAVTFTSHTDGQILTTARATISGGSGDAVLVSVSGVPATLDTATRTFVTSERALLEGENVLTFTAQDRAGNIGAATLRLIVDTRPPAVTIDTPASNACVDATTLQVTGSAADARLASVKVTVGQTSVAATLTGNNWTATVPVAEEGSAIVTVEATDSVGHTLSASRTLTVDRTAPVLDVRENGAEFTATIVNRAVSFFIRATDADSTVAAVATLDGQPYAAGTAVGNEGQHRLVVRATDCAGHVTEKTFDFTIDLTPPAIRNLQPENGGSTGTMPSSIRGTTDADAVRVELAAPAVGVEPAADGSFVIAAPFEEGTNRFTITARDRAGNSSSVDYSLRVKTTGPIVEIRESGSPMVSGTLFNRVVTPMIRTSETDATITATLNNAAFASGTAISNDGAYTLRATATDTLGHSVTEEVTFTIDRTPPVVKIESPLSGPATTESVEVRGSAGDAISAAVNGQAVSLDANGRFVLPSLVLNIGPNPIVATGRDQAGNIGRDEVLLTRDALGSGIIITYPPDRSRTNRATTDVVGRVLTPGRASSVTIGTRAVAVDATGGFRLSGYELIEGENTIRATAASADGTSNFAETRVTADFTPPSLTIRESGQPLSDGARFATQAVLTVDAADAGGGAVTTTLTIDGSGANPPATITREGGHAVIAVATDLAGNQTRAERTLFIGESSASGGCALSGFDPADRAVILASQTALVGRTGGAAGVKVNGVAATLADGSFFATVELPVEGDNAIRISCTDAAGVEIGTAVTITLQRVTGQPSITINSPAEDFVSAEETMTVSGTVGPGVVSADVNGVPATITGDDVGATRPFTVAGVRLSSGLNLLAARGRNAGGRTATASRRGLYIKDAPAVQISAPVPNLTTGVPSVAVSGTYTTLDPASLVVENLSTGSSAAAQYVRTSDTTGRWSVASVSLADGEQTLRVSGRDRLNRPATASVAVRLVAGYPTISITQPADQSWFGGAQESVTVAGAFQAAPGSAVDVNGVVATVNGNEYSAPVKFSTLAGGVTPIVARVTQPGGASAAAMITVRQLVAAPQVIESFPAPDAAAVDPGALLLVLFSQPMDVASVNAAFRLEDASGSPVTGARFLDRDVLTFAPATLLAPGRYTLRVAASATNLAGTPLAEPYSSAFTVAATAPLTPPVLAPLPASVCGDTISIEGTAAAGARVRLESGALTLSTTADSNGAFSFTYPISGQSGYALVRVRVVASDGSVSPAAERQVRVDCSGPQVLNAVYDRMVNQLTITFSEPVDSASLTSGSSVVMTLADGRAVGGTIAVSNNNALLTPSEDLTGKTFTLSITTAVRDVLGNPLVAPYSQQFAIGGEQPAAGDGSGFISGEVYDATTGRPLTGATIAIDVASPLPVTTTTDARGRYVARLPEGAHTIEASLSNYTTVWRGIIVPAGAGVIPIDIRLTRRGAAQTPAGSAITLTHGGDTAVTRRAELAIASGALQSGATVALTSIGGQALTGLLPLGWSPIAAAEVRLENASTLAAQLTFDVPASEIAAASQNLTAVQYDSSRDEWRVVTPVVNVSSTGAATFPLSRAGTFALVYPDRAPLVTPALPAAGDVLRG
ncbi:MAG TPA: Ig-like domain-containing protein, partial [Thermoanaerobaculia bacterium]